MGTYPRALVPKAAAIPNSRKKPEEIYEAFDYALANPKEVLSKIGTAYGFGSSTMSNWMFAPKRAPVNSYVVEWCRRHSTLDGSGPNNLTQWLNKRAKNKVGQRVLDAVMGRQRLSHRSDETSQEETNTSAVTVIEEIYDGGGGMRRLIGPSGIGTFVPGTTDDLLVVKEEALRIKAEAEAVALEASVLATAIDTVKDWLTDKDRLQQALGRIQNLESQLRESDTILKRFQQQKLAANQVHSND